MSPVPSVSNSLALVARQIWASTDPPGDVDQCITYTIQSPGLLTLNDSWTLNITEDAILKECGPDATRSFNLTTGDNSDEPYFASTSPVTFVLGICITIAWILLLMLLMTPRTYLTGMGSSRRRPDTGINVVGIGSRPWFQKVAALFVAIALLLAAVNTFDKAEDQYLQHYQDSAQLTALVLGSPEIRIVRFISTLFEWLAQAQTALRLFPRHRERIAIKWVALSLILLEMVFGIINSFTSLGAHDDGQVVMLQPRSYQTVFPALQYLFELALSLMYAAVIFYYALTKRRYAFYHSDMWNISLVAILSLVAVLVPVVFFVLDIAVPNIAAWGTYVRWVGAAAASVVVWEWVERIEALEREERKDGILGREIFEGDEILGDGASRRRARRQRTQASTLEPTSPTIASSATASSSGSAFKKPTPEPKPRYSRVNKDILRKIATLRNLAKTKAKQGATTEDVQTQQEVGTVRRRKHRQEPVARAQPPPMDPAVAAQQSASPVSRSDCTSASTVYRVVHHSISPTSTPGISETLGQTMNVISPVQEEPPADNTNEQRRSFMDSMLPFRRQSSGQSSQNVPPEIIAQQQARADEEAASQTRGKSRLGFGIFSRFRRAPSEECELPELVVPWRGEDNTSPHTDLESGQAMHSPTYEDPTDDWHGTQRMNEPRSPRSGNQHNPP